MLTSALRALVKELKEEMFLLGGGKLHYSMIFFTLFYDLYIKYFFLLVP